MRSSAKSVQDLVTLVLLITAIHPHFTLDIDVDVESFVSVGDMISLTFEQPRV